MDYPSASSNSSNNSINPNNLLESINRDSEPTAGASRPRLTFSRTTGNLSLMLAQALPPPPRMLDTQEILFLEETVDYALGDFAGNAVNTPVGNVAHDLGEASGFAMIPSSMVLPPWTSGNFFDSLKVKTLSDNTLAVSFPKSTTDRDFQSLFQPDRAINIDVRKITAIDFSMCTKLTGSSLHLLGMQLSNLIKLNLTGCAQFSDPDLFHLNSMSNLEALSLAGCDRLSAQGFENLSELLDNIKTLDLTGMPQVSDTFLEGVENMYQINDLVLTACTGFTDDGLKSLRKLPNLQTLLLDQCTQISDESLQKLARVQRFRNLLELNLNNCPLVTDGGVQQLQSKLPHQVVISHI